MLIGQTNMNVTDEQARAIRADPEVANAKDGLKKARARRDAAAASYQRWREIYQDVQLEVLEGLP